MDKQSGVHHRNDISALFAPRWFDQLGSGVRHVLRSMHHPSTNAAKESAWETTWAAAARRGQVEAAVTTMVGAPLLEACAAMIDKALFDDRVRLATSLVAKCGHFYPTSPYILGAKGNLAFMQGDHATAGRVWGVARDLLFLSGQHPGFREDLARRVEAVEVERREKSDPTTEEWMTMENARVAMQRFRLPHNDDSAVPLVFVYV